MTKESLEEMNLDENLIKGRAVVLILQDDGNWKGYRMKDGKSCISREVSPEYALQSILYNDGKTL